MTDTQQQPKIKFKKRNIKKKKLRKSTQTNDDDSAAAATADGDGFKDGNRDIHEEEEEGALHTILAVDRRRKLFNYRNRGVDSTHLLKASKSTNTATTTEDATNSIDTNKNKDLEERLKGTFSEGKLAGSNDMGGDDEGGILAKKHKRAMEEFIQQNLQGGGDVTAQGSNQEAATTATGATGTTEDEKELFAELLLQSNNGTTANNNPGNGGHHSKEGDVGAGGAMMMGSGIAEVALPASERLRTLKETERAAMEYEMARGGRGRSQQHDGGSSGNDDLHEANADIDVHGVVPMNFASGPGKRKRQEDADILAATTTTTTTTSSRKAATTSQSSTTIPSSSAAYSASSAGGSVHRSDVSTLGQSYSHNFQLHQQDWIAQRRDERQVEIDTLKTQQQQAEEADDLGGVSGERMGFEMARRAAKGESVRPAPVRGPNGESLKNEWDRTKKGGHQRSSDDRVWKQFMKKTKR